MYKKLMMMVICLCLTACASQLTPVNAPEGKIIRTADGAVLTPMQLSEALNQADIVLLGEKHDVSVHHQAETWLVAHRPQGGSTLLEMINANQEAKVRQVQQWLHQGGYSTKSGLARNMAWDNRWSWKQYGNLVEQLMRGDSKVLAANPSREALNRAGNFIPKGPAAAKSIVRKTLATIITHNHGGNSAQDVQHNVSKQQYKDAEMAARLINAPKPAWLIAGGVHVSKQLGVPLHLQDSQYQGRVLVVMLTVKGCQPENCKLSNRTADYIWEL